MIAEGQVTPERVGYNALPWKFTAGTPNILGTILSAQAMRLLLDFSLDQDDKAYFMYDNKIDREDVKKAMENITEHERQLIGQALEELGKIPGIIIYGPKDPSKRTSLVAFNHNEKSPFDIAAGLTELGVESRAGCHCATLAHHFYKLNPPASCRLSFYIYNNTDDVTKACQAVAKVLKN
jgi:cysteine desulfurase/selenocysteine lyase